MYEIPDRLIGLYYPYGMPTHEQTLKKALLYFDEVWFLDSLPFEQREKGFRGMSLNVYGQEETLFNQAIEIFNKNVSNILTDIREAKSLGVAKIVDVSNMLFPHNDLLTQALQSDVNDPTFVGISLNDHVSPWNLLIERAPESFIKNIDEESVFDLPNEYTGSFKFQKVSSGDIAHSLARQFAISGFARGFSDPFVREYKSRFPIFKTKAGAGICGDIWNKPYQHINVPFAYGASLHLNQSFIIAEQEDLMPFTEESTFHHLLTYKYRAAKENSLNSQNIISHNADHKLIAKMYQSILALKIIDIAFPISIEDLTIRQIIKYKKESRPELIKFREYLADAINAIIANSNPKDIMKESNDIIFKTLLPELSSLKAKMDEIYRDLFIDLAKKGVLTLGAASTSNLICKLFSGLSAAEIIAIGCAVAAGSITAISSELISTYNKSHKIKRHHLAYFLPYKG